MTVSDPPYRGVPPVPGYFVLEALVVVVIAGLVVVDVTELFVVVDAVLQEERAIATTSKTLKLHHINFLFICVEFPPTFFPLVYHHRHRQIISSPPLSERSNSTMKIKTCEIVGERAISSTKTLHDP